MPMKTRLVYDPRVPLAAVSKAYTLLAVDHFGGNKTRAAAALGITIKTIYNRLNLWDIQLTPWPHRIAQELEDTRELVDPVVHWDDDPLRRAAEGKLPQPGML